MIPWRDTVLDQHHAITHVRADVVARALEAELVALSQAWLR